MPPLVGPGRIGSLRSGACGWLVGCVHGRGHIKGEPEKFGLEMEMMMSIDAGEMRALRESLERRTKTLEALAEASARQADAEEQLADAYEAAIGAGWAKAELSDAGVKEPPLVRQRRREKSQADKSEPTGGDEFIEQ